MAQRAYRHRKETTISSLEKQVQGLRGTNEEMSNTFIALYDFAVGKGLLQREPEFGQQLQSTTEKILALAKASSEDITSEEPPLLRRLRTTMKPRKVDPRRKEGSHLQSLARSRRLTLHLPPKVRYGVVSRLGRTRARSKRFKWNTKLSPMRPGVDNKIFR